METCYPIFKKQQISFDIFLSLPTTAPLRSIIDIKKILKLIKKKNVDYVITAKKAKIIRGLI